MHMKLQREVVLKMHREIEAEANEWFIPEKGKKEWVVSLQPVRSSAIVFKGRTAKASAEFYANEFRSLYVSAVRSERERAMAAILSHGG